MFSWMSANQYSAGQPSGMPSDEAELDALVDDELDDDRRRAFLQKMDREPAGWRRVALRFLQRQVERRVVRDLMSATPNRAKPESRKSDAGFVRFYPVLRVAAMAVLVIGLVELLTPHNARNAGRVVVPTGGNGKGPIHSVADHLPQRQIQFLPGPASQYLGANAGPVWGGNIRQTANRVLLIPRGGDRIAAFPEQKLNSKGQPIY
jgi:hypothetical protein